MSRMSAVDKCINRLIVLEGEVNFLRSKVEEDQQWRVRMENWLRSRFDYDPNKSERFQVQDDELNLPSTSTIPSSASMSNGQYFSKATPTTSSSVLRKRQNVLNRSSGNNYRKQIMAYQDPESEGSVPISNVDLMSNSNSKRQRNYVSESVEIKTIAVDIEAHDDGVSWRTADAEEIKVEPCFEIESDLEEDGNRHDDGLNLSGDEWEICNSDEEDIEDNKFRVIGYEPQKMKYENEEDADLSGFGFEDCPEQIEEPSTSVTHVTTTFKRKSSTPSRLSLLKSNILAKPPQPKENILMPNSRTRNSSPAVTNNSNRPKKISLSNLVKTNNAGFQSVQQSRLQMNLSHLLQKGNNAKKPNCPYCGKPFNTPAEMMRHQRIHVGDKPFSCYICEYSTSFNGDLVRHVKSRHPGMDPYVCHICSFKCKELLMFNDHRRRSGHGGRGAKRFQKEVAS